MWLKLKTPKQIDINGVPTMKQAGDWVEVRNEKIARLWVSQGSAEVLDPSILADFRGVGIVCLNSAKVPDNIRALKGITVSKGAGYTLPHSVTIFVNGSAKLRPQYLPAAVSLLDKWQIIAPLWSYTELATDIGSEEAQERTRERVFDLRVPVYYTDMLFIRRDETTREFLTTWQSDTVETDDDARLTFLRTIFKVKPLLLAAPTIWWTDAKS